MSASPLRPHRPPVPPSEAILLDRAYEVAELPTPALVLDLAAVDRNLRTMADHLAAHGKGARPHVKTHKCPLLARRQMDAGAVGLCCAKVSEAEVLLAAGLDSVLITSPVVTLDKIARVVELARRSSELLLVLDHELGARRLSEAAVEAGVEVGVLIDLDPGIHRTGIALGDAAVALARTIDALPGLRLEGLQSYAGHLMHVHGHEERGRRSLASWEPVLETRERIERSGIALPILTGGGTGTFDIDCEVPEVTDLQVGSYLFMDADYRAIGGAERELFEPFETALWVELTAISQPVPQLITVDGGFKAFATDAGVPEPLDVAGVRYHWGGDEHGILELVEPDRELALGDRLRFRVPHCDPTVNLYDAYWVLRDGKVRDAWPIAARGRGQ